MRRLRIPNPDLHREEKTYLDADYSSGTSLTVIQSTGFFGGEVRFFTIVGEPGEDKTESETVTGITVPTTITIAAGLDNDHNKSTPVYRSPWDKVEISKMPSGGGWSVISQSAIQWDKNDTERKIVSDEEIIQMLDSAQDLVKGIRQDWWFLLVDTFKAANGITIVADTGTYSLATYTEDRKSV